MIDLKLDSTFNISFGPGGDAETVSGNDLLEQQLRIAVGAYFEELIGQNGSEETILNKVLLQANRVARELGFIEQLASIRASYEEADSGRGMAVRVELLYRTGDISEFNI